MNSKRRTKNENIRDHRSRFRLPLDCWCLRVRNRRGLSQRVPALEEQEKRRETVGYPCKINLKLKKRRTNSAARKETFFSEKGIAMSHTFQFTEADAISAEIEQYIWGKYGCSPPKALGRMILAQISKNPLTPQQYLRSVAKYGDGTCASLRPLSGSAKGDND